MNLTWREQCLHDLNEGVVSTADADISGIGVVLAFTLSAYITFAAVLYCYFAGFIEDELLNDVDRLVFRICPYAWTRPSQFAALRRTICVYGDQQIVTGIAIMAAGFEGLRTGHITVYHYQIVLYLAWMASSVHLSALTVLGTSLVSNKGLMIWRLAGMFVLFCLLLVALVPTTSNLWAGSSLNQPWSGYEKRGWGVPAKCFWDFRFVEAVNPDAPLGYLILIYSYLWKFGGLFPSVGKAFNRFVRFPAERILWRTLRSVARRHNLQKSRWGIWSYRLLLSFALPAFASIDCLASFATSLWISLLGLVFGTIQVIIPRVQNQQFTGAQESGWGFGQLVPVILLVQPLGILVEFLCPADEEKRDLEARYGPTSIHAQRCAVATTALQTTGPYLLLDRLQNTSRLGEDELADLRRLLCRSKLFATLVWLIQFFVVCTAATAFTFDASTIGNTSSSNWVIVFPGIVADVVCSVLLVAVFGPFSRLGRLGEVNGGTGHARSPDVAPKSPATAEMNVWEGNSQSS